MARTRPSPAPAADRRTRVVPFWVLQAAELAAAIALVDLSLHVGRAGLLLATAGLLAVLAVTAQGPLGLLRLCPRRLHLVLAYIVAAAVALAPIVPAFRPDVSGIIVVEFVAVGLARLASLTRTEVPVPVPVRATGQQPGPSLPPRPELRPEPRPEPQVPRGPSPSERLDTTARWLGHQARSTARSAAGTAAKGRPIAEERARQALRSAGKLTGKLVRPRPPAGPGEP